MDLYLCKANGAQILHLSLFTIAFDCLHLLFIYIISSLFQKLQLIKNRDLTKSWSLMQTIIWTLQSVLTLNVVVIWVPIPESQIKLTSPKLRGVLKVQSFAQQYPIILTFLYPAIAKLHMNVFILGEFTKSILLLQNDNP